MNHKHPSHTTQTREHKRAQFSDSAQQKTNKNMAKLVIVLTGLLAVGLYWLLNGINEPSAPTRVSATSSASTRQAQPANLNPTAPVAGDIRVPLSDIENGRAKFYDYTTSDNRAVRFFAIKSSDGVYRAALDACDVCYAAKKGYYQDGDDMICKKCSRHFPSALINEVHGGCNPIGLPRTINGGTLVIKASDLDSRKTYF